MPQEEEVKEFDKDSFTAENTTNRLVLNVAQTKYDIVKKVARKLLNWRCLNFKEDSEGAVRRGEHNLKLSPVYDLSWHDLSVSASFFAKLLPYQKVNMYPGI